MEEEIFNQQIEAAQQRLHELWQRTRESPSLPHPQETLTMEALQELSTVLEELQVATEELQQRNEQLAIACETVKAERQRYQELFEFAPDGYIVTNTSGIVQEANRTAASLLNRSQNSLIGKPMAIFVAKEDRKTFRDILTELNHFPQLHDWEVRLQPSKGQPFPAALNVAAIRDRCGNLIGLRWLVRDITERHKQAEQTRKALEQEKELSNLKSRFIRAASHEFRTPLTIISMSAELLERYKHKLSDVQKDSHFQKIRAASKQMARLLNDILLLDKTEAGKLELNPIPVDLVEFSRELVEELQLSIGSQHAITFIHQGQCANAYLDKKLLRQIIDHLLSNAIKYSPRGGKVHFELICQDREAIFQIQDEGIGIPKEDQRRLFERFHRGTNVGTISGTGLGLTIVKECVDLHDGAIAVESEVGSGTTFTVKLPLNQLSQNR
ncbi:PAS domain S-box protein [Coleofasciculus sp. FACHB-712]|uniref:PAS domain-containing sensor histidine kinase n=1 Tax=Coleofasciculus sp. FACHB-712 TaxID=2692789 RepID=UPI00168561E6|nr:ATP-binding protein [Coleofasciculus sp. FACHB-712]MBD1942860.1 PAS domain S-box protein [Coleofasciculus sp. FACHB-712]